MNNKITLAKAETVAINTPGEQVTFQEVTRFAVTSIQLSTLADHAGAGSVVLTPLGANDTPLPHAAPVRKALTLTDTGGISAEFEALIGKLFV